MPSYRFRAEKYVSRGFKDLAVSMNANPSTKDFGAVKNERAISQSVRNLLLTTFGERPFQPQIGSRDKRLLFEQCDLFACRAARACLCASVLLTLAKLARGRPLVLAPT